MEFVIFRGNDSKIYWHFEGANGEAICWTEGYNQKSSAIDALNLLRANANRAQVRDLT